MVFRFIHTADWQIGKVFRFVDDAKMGVLQEARIEAISRIGELAKEHRAEHVLVAGDVYDFENLSPVSRNQPLERMRLYPEIEWHLLPGNHDPHRPNGLWDRLSSQLPPNVRAHIKPEPVVIADGVAALLPAPLTARRTLDDPTAWMDGARTEDGLIRIGLAHGAVHGFSTDEEQRANPIEQDRPVKAGLDYLALGDWHGKLRVGERCWYSGTHETDKFSTRDGGEALLVEIDGPGAVPSVKPLRTGRFTWASEERHVRDREDVDRIEAELRGMDNLNETLLDLTVRGTLSLGNMEYFQARIEDGVSAAFRFLRVDRESLYSEPSADDLDSIDMGGVVRTAADRLKDIAEGNGDNAGIAREALLRLYVMHRQMEAGES